MANTCTQDQLSKESTPTNFLVFMATEALEFVPKIGAKAAKLLDVTTAYSGDLDEQSKNALIRVRKQNDGCKHIICVPNFAPAAFPECFQEMDKSGTHWRQYGHSFWHPWLAFEPKQPSVEHIRHGSGSTIAISATQRARTGEYDDIGISPGWCPQCVIDKTKELEELAKKLNDNRK